MPTSGPIFRLHLCMLLPTHGELELRGQLLLTSMHCGSQHLEYVPNRARRTIHKHPVFTPSRRHLSWLNIDCRLIDSKQTDHFHDIYFNNHNRCIEQGEEGV